MFSQLGQDEWVLEKLDNKTNGFFVEIGAGDGILNSNTMHLQVVYGWKGILVEPGRTAYSALVKNRSDVKAVEKAIGRCRGQAIFDETYTSELSCVRGYGKDHLAPVRIIKDSYRVHQITLDQLLADYGAPRT